MSDVARVDGGRARAGGLGQRVRALPAPLRGPRGDPRPDLADDDLQRRHDGLSRQAPGRHHASRPRPHRRRRGDLGAGSGGHVHRRHRRIPLGLLLRRRPFRRLGGDARRHRGVRPRCHRAGPRGRARRRGKGGRGASRTPPISWPRPTSRQPGRGARRHAQGGVGRRARRVRSEVQDYAIYEHCLPFNVARAYDEARGIDTPRIWTAERDQEMWDRLQG